MTLIDLAELYKNNKIFKIYVDKYARCHEMLPEDAMKCMAVKNYANYLQGEK